SHRNRSSGGEWGLDGPRKARVGSSGRARLHERCLCAVLGIDHHEVAEIGTWGSNVANAIFLEAARRGEIVGFAGLEIEENFHVWRHGTMQVVLHPGWDGQNVFVFHEATNSLLTLFLAADLLVDCFCNRQVGQASVAMLFVGLKRD